ncbi:MAG: T9SS type A sorting domain-containing protein [Bacteroidetes bacterium]|nr:T9SS type A sorting domain-containing protein [Bacteroidota bacterium]
MKLFFTILSFFIISSSYCQNLIFDDFSSFNLGKIDGQNGYSAATPSLGNGTGSCVGIGCIYSKIVDMTMSHPVLGNPTKALLCSDTTNFQTADGPGKSLGKTINSGAVYVAILVNCYQQNGSGTNKQIVRLMDNGFNVPCRLYVQNASGGSVKFGISKSSGGTTWNTNTYNTNQDYLIVMKYEFKTGSTSNDVVSVFIDPDLSLPEPTTPTFFISGNSDATAITRVVFPWNTSSTVFNGHIGINSVAQSWATIVPQTTTTYSIAGSIITPMKKLVPNTKAKYYTGQAKDSVITTSTGQYDFNNLSTANYTLKCSKLNEVSKSNGITSVDVLLTQRHILNTTKLNNAYKLIAADVNGDKVVNATDVLRIKRLILGTDTTFTKTVGTIKTDRLWEFVDSAYVFPDTTNPFPFKDSISFTNLTSNQTNQTFIGVKLGDVNYDWNPAVARQSVKSVELIVDRKQQASTTRYILSTINFKDLAALQYTLHFDNTKYEFVNLEGFKNLTGFEYNATKANATGNIAMLWTDKNAQSITLEDGSELFTLVLRAKELGIGNLELGINNDITAIEAWDNNYKLHNITLTQKVSNKDQDLKTTNQLIIYPNPAKDLVTISCKQSIKEIKLFDEMGRQIVVNKITSNNDKLQTLNAKAIGKGFYMVQVTLLNNEVYNSKLIVE